MNDEPDAIAALEPGGVLHGYSVSLEECGCMDFAERRLPCKHVYAMALTLQERISLTRAEYLSARASGKELIFEFPNEGV